jgi:cytochrome c551/c552
MAQYLKHIAYCIICCFLIACSQKKEQTLHHIGLIKEGGLLFQNSGCVQCHSLEGKSMYGPPLDSILNTQITVKRDSTELTIKIDKEYITRAIMNPDFEKVKAYQSKKMPIPILNPKQIELLVDYIILINTDKKVMLEVQQKPQ